jgi:hypothetical protein
VPETAAGGGGKAGLTAPRKDIGASANDSRITRMASEVKPGAGVAEEASKVNGGISIL